MRTDFYLLLLLRLLRIILSDITSVRPFLFRGQCLYHFR
jgi:hypothetical protein